MKPSAAHKRRIALALLLGALIGTAAAAPAAAAPPGGVWYTAPVSPTLAACNQQRIVYIHSGAQTTTCLLNYWRLGGWSFRYGW